MTEPGEGNTGGRGMQVNRLLYAAENFVYKHGAAVMAGILATAAIVTGAPAAPAQAESVAHPDNPTPVVTHSGAKPSAHTPTKHFIVKECASTGHIFGKNEKQKIMNYFVICQGDSVAQAAGVEGNLMQESTLQPEEVESGGFSRDPADAGRGGWGIAQWTPGSTAITAARKYGIKGLIYTLQPQLALVAAEMRGQSPTGQHNMLRRLKHTRDPGHAAETFEQDFEEGPIAAIGGGQLANRQRYARQAVRQCGRAALAARHLFGSSKPEIPAKTQAGQA